MARLACWYALVGVALSQPVAAASLQEMLARLPDQTVTSSKSSGELEYCIGVGIGRWLPPSTLRGDNRILVFADFGDNKVGIVVAIDSGPERRSVSYVASRSFDDRVGEVVRSCL